MNESVMMVMLMMRLKMMTMMMMMMLKIKMMMGMMMVTKLTRKGVTDTEADVTDGALAVDRSEESPFHADALAPVRQTIDRAPAAVRGLQARGTGRLSAATRRTARHILGDDETTLTHRTAEGKIGRRVTLEHNKTPSSITIIAIRRHEHQQCHHHKFRHHCHHHKQHHHHHHHHHQQHQLIYKYR